MGPEKKNTTQYNISNKEINKAPVIVATVIVIDQFQLKIITIIFLVKDVTLKIRNK